MRVGKREKAKDKTEGNRIGRSTHTHTYASKLQDNTMGEDNAEAEAEEKENGSKREKKLTVKKKK